MTMDGKPESDGRIHVSLGPVERWVVGLVATVCVGGGGLAYREMRTQLSTLTTQQAVANARLSDLSTQLSDVPALKGQVAELKVRTDRLEADVKELRTLR